MGSVRTMKFSAEEMLCHLTGWKYFTLVAMGNAFISLLLHYYALWAKSRDVKSGGTWSSLSV